MTSNCSFIIVKIDVYLELEEDLRSAVENCIGQLGGYDPRTQGAFIGNGSYREVKKVFERVMKEEIERFHTDKKRPLKWPLNDKKLKVTKKLSEFYPHLMKYIIDRKDEKGQALIEAAGGEPFRRDPIDNKYGNCVIRINAPQLRKDVGKSRETVFRRLRELVAAGVLVPLRTARNQPGLYVIGDWMANHMGGYRIWERLNRVALRDEIKNGLLEVGLVSEVSS